MSVNKGNIPEIFDIIGRYVPHNELGPLLADLRGSQAAAVNKSFSETIRRLLKAWTDRACPGCGNALSLPNAGCTTHGLHQTRKRP